MVDCVLHSQNQIIIGSNTLEHGRLVGGVTTAAMLLQVPLFQQVSHHPGGGGH